MGKSGTVGYYFIEFYLSLIAYYILHMIFVISSDFVDAFNIPPLNIGIYIDKLAAIRALLMVVGDAIEYGILDKAVNGSESMQKPFTHKGNDGSNEGLKNPRRWGSIISFMGMMGCRIGYLVIVYKFNNKSLYVFIVLCIEGFWFGVFQMSFFAIGPQYNAVTSFGIHTMGNFIFFFQLILEHYAKSYPKINPLYRVRVHGWICLVSSVIALCLWIYFCVSASGTGETTALKNYLNKAGVTSASKFKNKAVWSPFMLFIVGAFAEDFSVPGVLPFAFLDPERAALVNYLTPAFFMSGSIVVVLLNDVFTGTGLGFGIGETNENTDWKFKLWSASTASGAEKGMYWHALWSLNIPKYISFFIAMFGIHGIFPSLRCIVQSRWRVLVLTMFVVIPRSILEVAGYVGVANYASALAAVSGCSSGCSNWDAETAAGAGGFKGFGYIAYHDMLAMFCRFFYGKLAVGYNWTMKLLFYIHIFF